MIIYSLIQTLLVVTLGFAALVVGFRCFRKMCSELVHGVPGEFDLMAEVERDGWYYEYEGGDKWARWELVSVQDIDQMQLDRDLNKSIYRAPHDPSKCWVRRYTAVETAPGEFKRLEDVVS